MQACSFGVQKSKNCIALHECIFTSQMSVTEITAVTAASPPVRADSRGYFCTEHASTYFKRAIRKRCNVGLISLMSMVITAGTAASPPDRADSMRIRACCNLLQRGSEQTLATCAASGMAQVGQGHKRKCGVPSPQSKIPRFMESGCCATPDPPRPCLHLSR
jgi:hypothetical protein